VSEPSRLEVCLQLVLSRERRILGRVAVPISPEAVGALGVDMGLEVRRRVGPEQLPLVVDNVIFGTASHCNASCIHCPTNKDETAHLAHGSMATEFFRRIIDQFAAIRIVGQIQFGLFADPLSDRHIVWRADRVREVIPGAWMTLNTNAAAYRSGRHAALAGALDAIDVHIESLRPEVYDDVMRPLKLSRVLHRIDQIIADFGSKTHVGVPLHRRNAAERDAIRH
jgi:MoaA/NifB/PqqE/SkfB family radical SAM enzyme